MGHIIPMHGHMIHICGHMIYNQVHMIHMHAHVHIPHSLLSYLPQVASKCYHLRNYNSLKAILAGLQCTPIYRLKKTWKEVPSKRRK